MEPTHQTGAEQAGEPADTGISRAEFLKRAAAAGCLLAAPMLFSACDSHSAAGGGTTTQDLTVTIDSSRCNGCGHCVSACGHGVLAVDQSNRCACVVDASACEGCGDCLSACGNGAITLG